MKSHITTAMRPAKNSMAKKVRPVMVIESTGKCVKNLLPDHHLWLLRFAWTTPRPGSKCDVGDFQERCLIGSISRLD